MKLMRLGEAGSETPVIVHDGRYFDISGVVGDLDGAAFAGGKLEGRAGEEVGGELHEDTFAGGYYSGRCSRSRSLSGRAMN